MLGPAWRVEVDEDDWGPWFASSGGPASGPGSTSVTAGNDNDNGEAPQQEGYRSVFERNRSEPKALQYVRPTWLDERTYSPWLDED